MFTDYVLNGDAHGEVGSVLAEQRFDPGLSRPYIDHDGQRVCVINTGKSEWDETRQRMVPQTEKVRVSDLMGDGLFSPVFNSTSLTKDAWLQIDRAVVKAARQRLRAWSDIAGANQYSLNGMENMILEHETMSDPGDAQVDMDSLSEGRNDSPKFGLHGLPLPITHGGFHFSARRLGISRKSGNPLDTTMVEATARRVAETVEKTTIGLVTGITYGNTSDYVNAP
jgi:hypothetical protein